MELSGTNNSDYNFYYSPISTEKSEEEQKSIVGLNQDRLELSSGAQKDRVLSKEDAVVVDKMKVRDREVKSHEQAHIAAGGQYVQGGATYSYQTGPDGKQYAVGGEVNIDTSKVQGDPQATIQKMMVVRKAALAPGDPSAQDKSVAASASQTMSQARQDFVKERSSDTENSQNGYNKKGLDDTKKQQPKGSKLDLSI